jgi:SAM-dependent methyltransferase
MNSKNITTLDSFEMDISTSMLEYYRRMLSQYLEPLMPGYTEFFSNIYRLRLLSWLLERYFQSTQGKVLNVGCGAFAAEMLLPRLFVHEITSFDYTDHFAILYDRFREEGYLANTRFFVRDARLVELSENFFDLIIMNDIFYEMELSFESMLEKYSGFLKPGGLLIFDVMDIRTRRLWKLLGKEAAYRRYDRLAIISLLSGKGFEILECLPSLGNKTFLDRLFRKVLWYVFGLSNNFTFLAQKKERS